MNTMFLFGSSDFEHCPIILDGVALLIVQRHVNESDSEKEILLVHNVSSFSWHYIDCHH